MFNNLFIMYNIEYLGTIFYNISNNRKVNKFFVSLLKLLK